ncbi:TetR/AcrR family transcriptional regulator [Pseudobacteroides cellulosolvens]|uniref:Transcriptional regulator, TetR family n=1 Tax=Pseudobacteroides cellulosolvens ATCC 35603 = DSM 2933 TaxID=398512 RepID=A0A0L6JLN1_9FIRM|nr:TetR/AcrR family transcriptional regulator [Pseudobacteroides cellulosolvens]KNY26679.1 transcriptional regulator, TetR family [Pseudobacteroides cellulosolvens ATCC 35603 = DSM 2933]
MVSPNIKAEQTKNLIATKAKEVFIQKGYFQASMEDIRSHSGMSKGSIYYHFKSKEDLFIYILELYIEEWISKWREKSAGLKTAKDKLFVLAEHFALDFESPLLRAATEFSGSESADPKVKVKLDELNGMYIPVIQEVVQEGIDNNEFINDNINDLTLITYGFLAGVGAIFQNFNASDMSHMYKKSVEIFLDGLSKE